MKKIIRYLLIAFAASAAVLSGCTKAPSDTEGSGDQPDKPVDMGYMDPDGVLILNQGSRDLENSSITYIAPDGTIEEDIYRKANGTAFGNEAYDLYIYNGKIYLLSNGLYTPGGEEWDGILVIADAKTMKVEKAYKRNDLKFKRPEGSLDPNEWLTLDIPLENIAVLDENNVFIQDGQGAFLLDTETDELRIIEGSYHFGNSGATIEEVASARGILKVGDHLYCGGGGFWETTRLFEFAKDKDTVNRVIPDLRGDFISGLCQTGEREIVLATCGRGGETRSFLYFVDIDKWEITKEKQITADISAEFFNTSGIAYDGEYIYYSAGTTTISRMSLTNFRSEVYIEVTKDVPLGIYMNCNVTVDPKTKYLYAAVSNEWAEGVIPEHNYVLVYDCSGDTPELVRTIENQTSYPIGIFPVSRFL